MKNKTSSIGINLSGYPASASNFIVDNGCLLLIDSLSGSGHNTVLFDYNTAKTVDDLRIPKDTQEPLDELIEKIMSSEGSIDSGLLNELNFIENDVEKIRESQVRKKADELVTYCRANDIDFVWMKLWTGDGFKYSIAIAEEIKKNIPDIKIIGGGHHVRLFREKAFKFAGIFNVLSYADGEKVLPMLADWVIGNRSLDSIPGVLYQKDGKIHDTEGKILSSEAELNDMLIPKDFFGHYGPRYKGLEDKIWIGLTETARGCPESHVFCQHSINCGDYWRLIEPEAVVENFRRYHKNNIYANRIPDSNPPGAHLKKIYRLMKEQGLRGNSITAFCEIPQFDRELGQLFRDVGGYCLFFGIESGSQKVLDKIGKHYSPDEAARKIKIAKELGILTVTSFMVPSIGDDELTIRETEEWIRKVQPDCWPIGPTVPMNRILKNPGKYGYELGGDFFDVFQFYSPKLHLPPQLGGSLPVKKDGKDWNQLKAISGNLMNRLKGVGTPLASDETAMLAFLSGESPLMFNNNFTTYLQKGETERIVEYVNKINRNIQNQNFS